MSLLNVVFIATVAALAGVVVTWFVTTGGIRRMIRRKWHGSVRKCRGELERRSEQVNKFSDDVKRVDAVVFEHLHWSLRCVYRDLGSLESGLIGEELDRLIFSAIQFRQSLAYFDGYFAAALTLTFGLPATLDRLTTDARRELHEAADRISKLGWTLGGSSVVRSAMQEMAGSLREVGPAAPLDGLRSVAEALSKANRTLFAAMVESDTTK